MASRSVIVDEAALHEMNALAVLGAAIEVIEADEIRWLALDPEQPEGDTHDQ